VNGAISLESSRLILSLYKKLKLDSSEILGLRDLVPAYTSLAIHFDPMITDLVTLRKRVENAFEKCRDATVELKRKKHVFSVIYDGEDLERVASINNLRVSEVVDLHTCAEYTVAMIGFKPYFPYLIGLDPRLETARLKDPRNRVPAGSVAIGGAQTGIYPCESPGGWNLIGRMDPELLKALEPGDTVVFRIKNLKLC
jgi:KipI family sensor histidine kinase inhibitor